MLELKVDHSGEEKEAAEPRTQLVFVEEANTPHHDGKDLVELTHSALFLLVGLKLTFFISAVLYFLVVNQLVARLGHLGPAVNI